MQEFCVFVTVLGVTFTDEGLILRECSSGLKLVFLYEHLVQGLLQQFSLLRICAVLELILHVLDASLHTHNLHHVKHNHNYHWPTHSVARGSNYCTHISERPFGDPKSSAHP